MAEWLGRGLQILLRGFESYQTLGKEEMEILIIIIKLIGLIIGCGIGMLIVDILFD